MQRTTTRLRALITCGRFLELPSAYDPITARLEDYYRIERETVEKPYATTKRERGTGTARARRPTP